MMMLHTCIHSAGEVEKGESDIQMFFGCRLLLRSALVALDPILKARVGWGRGRKGERDWLDQSHVTLKGVKILIQLKDFSLLFHLI